MFCLLTLNRNWLNVKEKQIELSCWILSVFAIANGYLLFVWSIKTYWFDHLKTNKPFFIRPKNWIFFSALWIVCLVCVTCGAHHCSACTQTPTICFHVHTEKKHRLAIFWKSALKIWIQMEKESKKKTSKQTTMSKTMPSDLLLYICHHVNGDTFERCAGFIEQQKKIHVCLKKELFPFSFIQNKLLLFYFSPKFDQTYSNWLDSYCD